MKPAHHVNKLNPKPVVRPAASRVTSPAPFHAYARGTLRELVDTIEDPIVAETTHKGNSSSSVIHGRKGRSLVKVTIEVADELAGHVTLPRGRA
ncbi:hypothetical protein SEA_DARDANUS_68 [Gordonia phage Dardanus]|uniref:Uncharacterized protein n=1 Tax=Gordonia phage Dardanus TaxID=2588489 RepID=A0A514CX67_9CAUD|nr:hypothetical protein KDJ58_gp68 [Gordonia phage Dardanus]QDH85105.1 hypothetical protein SEA_DARDANUS_68 [Gordonia phage Dardanus]